MDKDLLLIGRYFTKFYERYCEEVCKEYQLSQMELDVIAFLANNPEMDTARDIVEVRKFTKSNVSQVVEQLIKKELLKRIDDVEDRRKIHLVLLPKSKNIVKDIRKMQNHFSSDLMAGFSEDDKKVFGEYISKMLSNILEGIGRVKENGK